MQVELIKYDSNGDMLVWKHPRTDFHTAIVIVRENQEAILLKNGCICKLFGSGKYTVSGGSIPSFGEAVTILAMGGTSANQNEVFFICKNGAMKVYWGTATPVMMQDPVYDVPVRVRAHGSMTITVQNSVALLQRLAESRNSVSMTAFESYCRGMVVSKVKEYVANYAREAEISSINLATNLESISTGVRPMISALLSEYGIAIETFIIESLDVLEDRSLQIIREQGFSNFEQSSGRVIRKCPKCHVGLVPNSKYCYLCGSSV